MVLKNADYDLDGALLNARALKKYGIYITNNERKMHGQPMKRRIAGRKGARKHK